MSIYKKNCKNYLTGRNPKKSHTDVKIRKDGTRSNHIQCRVHV